MWLQLHQHSQQNHRTRRWVWMVWRVLSVWQQATHLPLCFGPRKAAKSSCSQAMLMDTSMSPLRARLRFRVCSVRMLGFWCAPLWVWLDPPLWEHFCRFVTLLECFLLVLALAFIVTMILTSFHFNAPLQNYFHCLSFCYLSFCIYLSIIYLLSDVELT
jgi:hypothetical protein